MTIRVLRRHIKSGERKQCKTCPIALAIKEQTSEIWSITPSEALRLSTSERYQIPSEARLFISAFDGGYRVKPFTFKITLQND